MKATLSKAADLKLALDAKETADAETKKRLEEANKKAAAEALEGQYERPQSKAAADAFKASSKEHFELSSVFENAQDSASKTYRMKVKMNINRRIGQINDSMSQIRSIIDDLVKVCYESRSVSRQAYSYTLVLLASKFIVSLLN